MKNVQMAFALQRINATGGIVATFELTTYTFCSQTIEQDYEYPQMPVDKCVEELLVTPSKEQINQQLAATLYNLWITDNVN